MKFPRLGIFLLCVASCAAQTPFRVDVQLVNVGFSVRDSSGKLVTNLTQDDFEVIEDGVPQKISFFAKSSDVPLNLGLVVDLSGSQGPFIKQHHKDLKTFLTEVLTPQDRAFLVCFGGNVRLVTEYSPSAKFLSDALEGFQGTEHKGDYPMLGPREIRTQGTSFYDAIYHTSRQMLTNAERGRKAMIIFSDGEDNASAHHMMDAIEAAQTNNVLLFCIRYTDIRNGRENARNKYGTSVMARLARETGGMDYDAKEKGLAQNFREIGEQLRSSYELGYHSTSPDADESFHKVVIRGKQGTPAAQLTVHAKTGYYSRVTER
ncbi:MAG TPA: VWA domain-containing protein [Bryobacteraceae bacterium]|nr:VWA domain-containing protein [Bryobacteraceae bacterium]